MFSGVDAELAGQLAGIALYDDLSLDNPVALANADPEFIVEQLTDSDSGSGSGVSVSLGFAQRLVDEARSVIPASEWSLSEASLGLKASELELLKNEGVRTKGALTQLDQTTKAKLGALLQINADKVDQLVEGVKDGLVGAKNEFIAAPKNSTPVTKLFGITRERGKLLAKLGAGSMAKLAVGNAVTLAPAFGGDEAAAAKAIEDAVGFIGLR